MQMLSTNKIIFISEQDGDIERQFKRMLVDSFIYSKNYIRAYLVKVQYELDPTPHVALCIKTDTDLIEPIIDECTDIFSAIFSGDQHLDIIFISDAEEKEVRLLCCPFYTSNHSSMLTPDFYMFSSDSYSLADQPRSCFKRKSLYGSLVDGYILCDIDPVLIGQSYGLGARDIDQVIIASRLEGMSLFPIGEWPTYVYVFRPLIKNIELKTFIEQTDIELIAWAEIYKDLSDIPQNS